jgi:putative PIN family toxin of toxin-antitoxin system
VVDTNIFVSALLSPKGAPAQVPKSWQEHRFILLTSSAINTEITETLAGFIGRAPYNINQQDINEILDLLQTAALMVAASADVSDAGFPDVDDLVFLACAVDGFADIIASGDKHLKTLKSYRGIPIITARDLLERLEIEPGSGLVG